MAFEWLRSKFRKTSSTDPSAGGLPSPDVSRAYADSERLRRENEGLEARLRQERAEEEGRKRQEEEMKKRAKEEEKGEEARYEEERVKDIPPHLRKKYKKRIEEATEAKEQAAFEVWESSVPSKVKTVQRVWQPGYWTDKATGQPVPEPENAEQKRAASYRPGEYKFVEVDKPLAPHEQLALARATRIGSIEMGMAEAGYKQWKREKSLPVRTARAAIGLGEGLAAVGIMGVAGTARGMQPGRGGPQRAARMHAPSLPLDLYGVKPMLGVGVPSSRDLTGSGLGHLRSAVLPRMRRPTSPTRQRGGGIE